MQGFIFLTPIQKNVVFGFLLFSFLALNIGVASAAVTINANAFTSDGALTVTGAATSIWSLSAGNLTLNTAAGNLVLDIPATGQALNIGPSQTGSTITIGGGTGTGAITLGSSSNGQTVNIGTGAGASTVAVATGNGGNTLTIGTGTGANSITIGNNTTGVATLGIANGTAGNQITIGNGANTVAQSISIGAGANGANNTISIGSGTNTAGVVAVTIGSNAAFANTTTIQGGNGTGAISLTPTGAGTIIIGAPTGTGAITLGSSSNGQTVNIGTGAGAPTVSIATGAAGSVTIGAAGTTNGNGVRIVNNRFTINHATAPVVFSDAAANPTVTQILDAGIFTMSPSTNRLFTLPAVQGSSGLVQGLPGTPAIGDVFSFVVANKAAVGSGFNIVLAASGSPTGYTLGSLGTVQNATTTTFYCRVTGVSSGSETITCY